MATLNLIKYGPNLTINDINIALGITTKEEVSQILLASDVNIPDNAFKDFTSLNSINYFSSIKKIGKSSFENCISLQAVNLLNTDSIGENAFKGCKALRSVILKSNSKLSKNIFDGCISLTEIKYCSAINSIELFAFNECCIFSGTNFKNCDIIGYNAFKGTPIFPTVINLNGTLTSKLLLKTNVKPNTNGKSSSDPEYLEWYDSDEHPYTPDIIILASNNVNSTYISELLTTAQLQKDTVLNIEFIVTNTIISENAFAGFTALTGITGLSNVTDIQNRAFAGCSSITDFDAPNCESLGISAFAGCKSLTSLNLPKCEYVLTGALNGIGPTEDNYTYKLHTTYTAQA